MKFVSRAVELMTMGTKEGEGEEVAPVVEE